MKPDAHLHLASHPVSLIHVPPFSHVITAHSVPPGNKDNAQLYIRDGASTIQMYSSTSTITLNMHEYEYEYSENKCTRVRVRLLYNVLEYEYDYIRM